MKPLFGHVTTLLVLASTSTALSGQVGKNNGVLNPNTAGEEELRSVSHVTPAIASAIIAQRPFLGMTAFDQLLKTSLTAEQLQEVYVRLFVPINLNSATPEEILMVPGVGERMKHEFEEYRPYRALAQFRREIGKYVDDAEVARLEQYVFVPIDLNTASDEDILSIPGLGPRMLREFKEYRPYRSLEQFRREIGKYVSDKEVARFERYVVIN